MIIMKEYERALININHRKTITLIQKWINHWYILKTRASWYSWREPRVTGIEFQLSFFCISASLHVVQLYHMCYLHGDCKKIIKFPTAFYKSWKCYKLYARICQIHQNTVLSDNSLFHLFVLNIVKLRTCDFVLLFFVDSWKIPGMIYCSGIADFDFYGLWCETVKAIEVMRVYKRRLKL